jgi:mono/diheme cytochrome c family protein
MFNLPIWPIWNCAVFVSDQNWVSSMIKTSIVSLAVTTANLLLPSSASSADIATGRSLAEQWCSRCHNIQRGAPFKLQPPSFASIAAYRDADSIRGKIIAPHIGMPEMNWVLQPDDMDNLVAYITSLEAKQ